MKLSTIKSFSPFPSERCWGEIIFNRTTIIIYYFILFKDKSFKDIQVNW